MKVTFVIFKNSPGLQVCATEGSCSRSRSAAELRVGSQNQVLFKMDTVRGVWGSDPHKHSVMFTHRHIHHSVTHALVPSFVSLDLGSLKWVLPALFLLPVGSADLWLSVCSRPRKTGRVVLGHCSSCQFCIVSFSLTRSFCCSLLLFTEHHGAVQPVPTELHSHGEELREGSHQWVHQQSSVYCLFIGCPGRGPADPTPGTDADPPDSPWFGIKWWWQRCCAMYCFAVWI